MFGTNMRPTFNDMIQLKTIDQTLVPRKKDKARLIVVGDVHGCHDERMSRVKFSSPETGIVVLVSADMI